MMLLLGILIGLVSLTILVALHELGHAYAAIKNGVVVEEFGLGFPPTAYKFTKKTDKILPKGTVIAINWLPIGGYVKLQGEHDSDIGVGDYGAASFWAKTQILFAGVVVNWLTAAVIFTFLAWIGLPKAFDNQFYIANDARITGGETLVTTVIEGLPADDAGIKVDDVILRIDGEEVKSTEQISEYTKNKAGEPVDLEIKRSDEIKTVQLAVREENNDGKGYIGMASYRSGESIYATWSAPIVGVGTTIQFTGETFKGLGELVVNFFGGLAKKISFSEVTREEGSRDLSAAGASVAGPIGILGIIFPQAAQAGIVTVLFLTAIISLTLAVINILPIPALDGGRWLMTFIFRKILGKPLRQETEETINAWGFLFILALSLLIIVVDILRF